jgi:hypothetical protein
MQSPPTPTEDNEASIPMEHVLSGPHLSAGSGRKATKRSLPWNLVARKIHGALPPPQDEDIPAMKKPRLDKPYSTSTDEATTENMSHDTMVALTSPDAAAYTNDHADSDPVMDIHPNATTARAGTWTAEADTNATTARAGKWAEEEDIKLKNAVQKHHGKSWDAIARLVPGRTRIQCKNRWHDALDPSIGRANGRTGKWTEDECIKLRDAVQTHGDKSWGDIAALLFRVERTYSAPIDGVMP